MATASKPSLEIKLHFQFVFLSIELDIDRYLRGTMFVIYKQCVVHNCKFLESLDNKRDERLKKCWNLGFCLTLQVYKIQKDPCSGRKKICKISARQNYFKIYLVHSIAKLGFLEKYLRRLGSFAARQVIKSMAFSASLV